MSDDTTIVSQDTFRTFQVVVIDTVGGEETERGSEGSGEAKLSSSQLRHRDLAKYHPRCISTPLPDMPPQSPTSSSSSSSSPTSSSSSSTDQTGSVILQARYAAPPS